MRYTKGRSGEGVCPILPFGDEGMCPILPLRAADTTTVWNCEGEIQIQIHIDIKEDKRH